jgi:hypothetical protein
MSQRSETVEGGWHLDKRVPIAIIGALIVQTLGVGGTAIAWKTSIEANVDRNGAAIAEVVPVVNAQSSRLSRLEAEREGLQRNLTSIQGTLIEMNRKLDNFILEDRRR